MILLPWRVIIPVSERVPGMDKPEWWIASGELPGVFNWAIAGLHRLRQQGRFTESAICTTALDEYRSECNPERTFLSDNLVTDTRGQCQKDELYDAYRTYCAKSGLQPLSKPNFGKQVFRQFRGHVTESRPTVDGKRLHVYTGIRWMNPYSCQDPSRLRHSAT